MGYSEQDRNKQLGKGHSSLMQIQIRFFSLYEIMIYGRSTHKDLDTIGKKVAIKIVKRNPDWY